MSSLYHIKNRVPNTLKLIVILGQTATGKSGLAVRLAKKHHGEVISADSRQVYRGLNIGTGKITKKEMCGTPHHLLDVASPKRQFTVSEYIKLARSTVEAVWKRGKLPIVCGGTGLYIGALLGDINIPNVPPNKALRKKLEKKSAPELFQMLEKLDPKRAKNIDRHNPRRLVRAIEIAKSSIKPLLKIRSHGSNLGATSKILKIGLTLPPKELKKKISIRLFARMKGGMLREGRKLHDTKTGTGLSWKRMRSLGLEYRYLAHYLQKKISKKELVESLKKEIWDYARRQNTWFKRDKTIQWYNPKDVKKIEKTVEKFLKKSPMKS